MNQSGIVAPDNVPEGTNSPIQVEAPGSTTLDVLVVGTGERLTITLDESGKGSFVLPASALSGEEISIIDLNDPSICAQISVVPASGAAPPS